MTLTASVGLLTMFVVDFVDLIYIAQLGDSSLTAAMGYAATILFFGTAFNIGLMIAASALAARRIGAGAPDDARRYLTNVTVMALAIMVPLAGAFYVFAPELLALAGADGKAQEAATGYVRIVACFLPFSVTAMVSSGFLRAHGAARRAMNVTLSMGITNAALDPIFIFALDWGIDGAARASACAAIVSMVVALRPVVGSFGGFAPFDWRAFVGDLKPIWAILLPAILTNIATPVGGFITYRFISGYSDDVIAAFAVIGRITPVAFALLFSLSGAVGPIIGQNFGAFKFDRVRLTIDRAMLFAGGYTLLIWPLLVLLASPIADLFNLQDEGRAVFRLFAIALTPLFFFNGLLFISNAACNNLDRPQWSAALNWLRNTAGIWPFLYLGERWFGLDGVVVGPGLGGVVFGLGAYWVAKRLVARHEAAEAPAAR